MSAAASAAHRFRVTEDMSFLVQAAGLMDVSPRQEYLQNSLVLHAVDFAVDDLTLRVGD
jgi:hypothetical protein